MKFKLPSLDPVDPIQTGINTLCSLLYLLCANYVLIFCELFQPTQINLSERCLAGFLFLILRTQLGLLRRENLENFNKTLVYFLVVELREQRWWRRFPGKSLDCTGLAGLTEERESSLRWLRILEYCMMFVEQSSVAQLAKWKCLWAKQLETPHGEPHIDRRSAWEPFCQW